MIKMPNAKKMAGYHGVEGMKYAPRKADGTYDTPKVFEMAQGIDPTAVTENAEQYADDRLVLRLPSDKGYDGNIGTTAQDVGLETDAGFLVPAAGGMAVVSVAAYFRAAVYYEFIGHYEDGTPFKVKTWMYNVEIGKGSESHTTDKSSVEFGSYSYPFHCYGDPLMDAEGTKHYMDANGMERTAYMLRAVPGDEGYETFGEAVPVPKVKAPAAEG